MGEGTGISVCSEPFKTIDCLDFNRMKTHAK
jgi:hypothetical protein